MNEADAPTVIHPRMDELATGHAFKRPEGAIELRDFHGGIYFVDELALDMRVDHKKVWFEDGNLYIEFFNFYNGGAGPEEMRLDRFLLERVQREGKTTRRVVHKDGNPRNCTIDNLAMLSGNAKESRNAA